MNDLRFIFTTPDKKIPSSLTLLDGKLIIYKRSQSQQWQCRFKLSNCKWHSASCATSDLEAAKQQAIVLYETVTLKVDAGLAIHVKTFGHIAREEIARLARIATTRQGERKYKDYLFILEKYLIPFFGNYRIAEITDEVVAEFSAWRLAVMGKEAKAMTKKHHAMAFNRIVQIARERHYVYSNHTVPQLDITGAKSEPRPAFSNEEIHQLYAYTPIWQKDVIHKDSEAARILCTAYVKFLVNTGVRHSTESMPLRWKHLQWHYIGSKRYLRIWVSGKTGARYLIAKHEVIAVLEELLRWQQLPYRTLDEVIKVKLDRRIFVLQTGEMPHLLENIFRHLMVKSGLQKNAAGQNRTLYSLRHTYATEALAKGIDIHTLAKQMGTSVVMIEKHYSKLTAMMSAERLA
jgi:integrase